MSAVSGKGRRKAYADMQGRITVSSCLLPLKNSNSIHTNVLFCKIRLEIKYRKDNR